MSLCILIQTGYVLREKYDLIFGNFFKSKVYQKMCRKSFQTCEANKTLTK